MTKETWEKLQINQ